MGNIDKVKAMDDKEILKAVGLGYVPDAVKDIWQDRHEMDFPYCLDHYGNIANKLHKALMGDREVPKSVLGKANELRKKRDLPIKRHSKAI